MTVKKKYESTDETIEVNGVTLHRIRALRNFRDVYAGDLGGFIENESNLSHEGDCWVGDDAKVYGSARVYGRAKVFGNANVYDNAHVYGNAIVYFDAKVFDNAHVYGTAIICGNARVCGDAWIDTGFISGCDLVNSSKKKYELTDDTVDLGPFKLHRIRALRSFGKVKKGDLGGWVESEENLSHEGNCWISGLGAVFGGGRLRGDHLVPNFNYISNTTYKLSMLTPQQYMASLPWHRRIWERLRYYWECGIWL
ncbi:hypothetical protein [Bartonella sp. CL162QHHD]|uniref:hypothetical protein n=1 Tax=Bartonella sp. CL162QHHD TaxID=3243516 RepID=UPI0035D0C4A2